MTFYSSDLHNDNAQVCRCPCDPTGCRAGEMHKINSHEPRRGSPSATAYMALHFFIIFSKDCQGPITSSTCSFDDVSLIFLPLRAVIPFFCGPMTIA